MILTRVAEGLLVVRQPDHGTQTGLFAQAWGNERVPSARHHRREAELAARHHDDGWAVWERRPSIDPTTARPTQFLDVSPIEHVPLYRAGIARAAQHDPWVGLLVSMHGAGLYNDRYGTFRLTEQHFNAEEQRLVDEFLADMAGLQGRLLSASGHAGTRRPVDDPEAWEHYLLLQVWDRLSLQYAFRLAADGVIRPAPGTGSGLMCRADGPFGLVLDPYPFAADRMTFPVDAAVVPDRPYRTPEEFLAAVADATPTALECRARAGTSVN
jgi:hypothetical protein